MDNSMIEKYKQQAMQMMNTAKSRNPEYSSVTSRAVENTDLMTTTTPNVSTLQSGSGNGKLKVNVTALRKLYPVENASVTVFTGPYENMNVVDTSTTDRSGKSKVFTLPAPSRIISLSPGQTQRPYTIYNILVEADGYIPNINMNVPIFDLTTSVQNVDLVYISAAGTKTMPRIQDTAPAYRL